MSMNHCLRILGLGVLALTWGGCTPPASPPPNFVFILVDDLGYMDIAAYNPAPFYETPTWIASPAKACGLRRPMRQLRFAALPAPAS